MHYTFQNLKFSTYQDEKTKLYHVIHHKNNNSQYLYRALKYSPNCSQEAEITETKQLVHKYLLQIASPEAIILKSGRPFYHTKQAVTSAFNGSMGLHGMKRRANSSVYKRNVRKIWLKRPLSSILQPPRGSNVHLFRAIIEFIIYVKPHHHINNKTSNSDLTRMKLFQRMFPMLLTWENRHF